MKKILLLLGLLIIPTLAFAYSPFYGGQLGNTPTTGFVLQSTGAGSIANWVATSTLGITGGGGGGSVNSVTATAPVFSSGGTNPNITWTGISTSSPFIVSRVLYASGLGTVANVATSSVTNGTGITFSGTVGALVGGTALTITNSGVISNSCPGGFLSCSGTNPSSFSLGTLGVANGGTNATSQTLGNIWYDGSKITSTSSAFTVGSLIGTTTASSTLVGALGIGTTSPSMQLDIFSTGTSSLRLDNNSTKGGCITIKDRDGVGYTYITANNGVLYSSTVNCN